VYQRAPGQRRRPSATRRVLPAVVAVLGLLTLVGTGAAFIPRLLALPGPTTAPTAITPPPFVSLEADAGGPQACRAVPTTGVASGLPLVAFALTIRNGGQSNLRTDWSLTVPDMAPGGREPWVTAVPVSGTLEVGESTQVQLTSSPVLCR